MQVRFNILRGVWNLETLDLKTLNELKLVTEANDLLFGIGYFQLSVSATIMRIFISILDIIKQNSSPLIISQPLQINGLYTNTNLECRMMRLACS